MPAIKAKKVLVIGSGPIVIGQAAEFDYAGAQACKALREEGVESVLLNSNPATIMTDAKTADRIYIEPVTVGVVERIIKRERPDGILGTLGGQTGLNLLVELGKTGILEEYSVSVLGTGIKTIEQAEDRDLFRSFLKRIGEPAPPSKAVNSIADAVLAAEQIGYPVIVRPAYTLGGTGGGIAADEQQLRSTAELGLSASRVSQVLIERSLWGWKEIEYEVVRDGAGNTITVCNMENMDPVGVHTGDSIVVAPSQTLTDREYQSLRNASLRIVGELGVEGGCNVQFAQRPRHTDPSWDGKSDDYYVIEVNPRVSRSSALASKATGYPIARVATKIALGLTLDKIRNEVTHKTNAAFEPALDYCVVKIPRWPFDKFGAANRTLGTQMKSTGEVMAIGRSFEAALQKAVRSLEDGHDNLAWEHRSWRESPPDLTADDLRLWKIMASLRRKVPLYKIVQETGIDEWFISALDRIVDVELRLSSLTGSLEQNPDLLRIAKQMGFSDAQIAGYMVAPATADYVRALRKEQKITPVYKMVDTCAGEFEAFTPYFYSTYEEPGTYKEQSTYEEQNEARPLDSPGSKSVLVLGSGPIRIGQGIEFDYSSVHAAKALQERGCQSIMINSNPETVSTDFDTSARLYFEPLDEESVQDVLENEVSSIGVFPSTMVQFGGQTAINLSQMLGKLNWPISGSSADTIDQASERGRFEDLAARHKIPLPPGDAVHSLDQALATVAKIGYPVVVRPSYVLGGRAMEIVQNDAELTNYFNLAHTAMPDQTILVDRYMLGIEIEVDAVCDGHDVLIPGILQHIERAGVHSGDSACVYPAPSLSEKEQKRLVEYTEQIGRALNLKGLMNIQYVIPTGSEYAPTLRLDDPQSSREIYVIEVNPRASRTVPFISKVTSVPLVQLAIGVAQGDRLRDLVDELGFQLGLVPPRNLTAVKVPVFSTSKLAGVDTFLGPEMKSTGEVMGIDFNLSAAVLKGIMAAGLEINPGAPVLLSIADRDKPNARILIERLAKAGNPIWATAGTANLVSTMGHPVKIIEKRLNKAGSNVLDVIRDGTVKVVINTVTGDRTILQDGFYIRRAAVEHQIPCFTSLDTALVATEALVGSHNYSVRTVAEYVGD